MSSSSRTRTIVVMAGLLATSLTLSLVWTLLLGVRSKRVVLENCSAAFCLRVAEGVTTYGLSSRQHYEIWITRRQSPDYGYMLDHSFGWHDWNTEVTIRASKVEWSDAGVTLLEPTGQRLFVPVALYANGR
jgi:hypothetical protein